MDWAGSQWGYSENPEPPEVLEDEEFAETALEAGRIYAVRYMPLQPVEEVVPELP
jgi:hypothetical protein